MSSPHIDALLEPQKAGNIRLSVGAQAGENGLNL